MSEKAGNDETDGGSRATTQPAAEPRPFWMDGPDYSRWTLDEKGVWRKRPSSTGNRTLRLRGKAFLERLPTRRPSSTTDRPPRPEGEEALLRRLSTRLRPRPPGSHRKLVTVGLGVIGVVGLVAALILSGVFPSNNPTVSGFQPTATNPALAASQTAQAFLTAWQHGHLRKAANYTNHPAAAAAALTSYRDGLHLRALDLAVHSATARGTVAFSVDATVGLPANPAARAIWSYASDLVAYSRDGGWWVRWNPALLAPKLTVGEKVVSVPIAPGAAEVVDAAGADLQDSTDYGLKNIAAALMKTARTGQGTPGIEVAFLGSGNTPVAGSTEVLSQPIATGVVKTTIDPKVEAAAASAVQFHAGSAMVVIQPTTGDILAVANNDGANDFALTARVAPGSTNKIITSTALFTTGLVSSPSQPVECPPQVDADGEVINNAGGESEPPGTPFITDFAASCNNAFDRWYSSLGPQTLAQTAQKYYGLNRPWNIGIGTGVPYYTIPAAASNAELALELFGQGQLETAPLAMASVAATVDTGSFRQPIVVPGQPQLAATPLPASVHQYLWQLMGAVTQSGGTAAGVFDGVGSAVYAKTGTADVSGQGQPNSWMVAFDPTLNVAVGCLVLNAGYGAAVAGPEAASVLQQLAQSGG